MATGFDVAGRLAEGLTAVEDMQTYVNASRVRGYRSNDLTVHSEQVRECYQAEDGLDLQLLDGDRARWQAAAQVADDVLVEMRSQAALLSGAWDGAGGDAAGDFVGRHCAAAATVTDAVRTAADVCAALRDQLWRLVERKVEATTAAAGQAQRPGWLAAASAVSAGVTGDDDPSAAVVDTQITPFVDNVIRGQWVPAMRAVTDEVAAAYRVAADAIGAHDGVRFEVPGDLGPRYVPPAAPASRSAAPVRAAAAASLDDLWPAELTDPGLPSLVPPAAGPAPVGAPAPNPLEALTSPVASPLPPPSSGLGSLPGAPAGGLPTGGGIGDIAGRIADMFGGLLDNPGGDVGELPEPPELSELAEPNDPDDPDGPDGLDLPDDPDDPDDDPDDTDKEEDTEEVEPENIAAATTPEDDDCATEPAEPAPAPVAPNPEPTEPAPPPPPPAPLAAPAPEGATPCEIAADELPQAGQ
ncbi:MAG: hypothetical protein ABWY93_14300 [Mycobacterium sp.]